MEIPIQQLYAYAKLPTRFSELAAGHDLYSCFQSPAGVIIPPFSTMKIGTGIAMAIPEGYFGATNQGLRPANCVGVIDADYRGEIIVALHNDTNVPQVIPHNERIAQIVILPCLDIRYDLVEDLDETERGDGGFGSTGTD